MQSETSTCSLEQFPALIGVLLKYHSSYQRALHASPSSSEGTTLRRRSPVDVGVVQHAVRSDLVRGQYHLVGVLLQARPYHAKFSAK